ncbi:hypothetical protein SNE40_000724 [Patella caerulea]|uniref:TCTP domain-containing protein n=1 Tax=Patella caerulea TaxID=87958 RepID=A0AAN8KCB1_PATCE
MLIFKDKVTGDELFSDANNMKLVDHIYYEVYGKVRTENTGIDESLLGSNPSAEEAQETACDGSVSGIDVVLANRLKPTGFDKKGFGTLIKDYFKKGIAALDDEGIPKEEIDEIKKRCGEKCKKLYSEYKEMEFWLGESQEPEGLIGISYYTGDTEVTMIFFKFGLNIEKF